MNLPFLKKWPRVNPEHLQEKTYNMSPSEKLEEHCLQELMDAVHEKDVSKFRSALEALILNCFEYDEEPEDAH